MKKYLLIPAIIVSILFASSLSASGVSDKTTIKLQIGSKNAYIDGVKKLLDVPPIILDGRTLVPIRFVSEGIGAQVDWDAASKTITITMDSLTYLKTQINSLTNDKIALQKENTQLKDKTSQLQNTVNTLTKENNDLKKKVSELEETLKKTEQLSVQTVEMHITYEGFKPNVFNIKKGIPVKWIIYGDQISSCTNKIIVPSLNISKSVVSGENVVNFTPSNSGTIDFSCWMGMVRGKFIVE